ncbi:MAG TPA: PDZ domain-containing protein, partial [Acidimicrobiia bacterium]|nr:PDZ domain-containing protein [Acidimicrobiia bacterium]
LVGGAGFWLGRETGDDDGDRTEAAERTLEPRQGPSAPGVPNLPNLPDLPNPPQTPQGRQLLGVAVEEADNGAAVARVASGSPADDAGLEVGDVITEVDGDSVSSAVELVAAIRSHDPGDEISITYERDGETTTVQVTLADLSSDGGSAS